MNANKGKAGFTTTVVSWDLTGYFEMSLQPVKNQERSEGHIPLTICSVTEIIFTIKYMPFVYFALG